MAIWTSRGSRNLVATGAILVLSAVAAAVVPAAGFDGREIADVVDFDRDGRIDLLLTNRKNGGEPGALSLASRQADGSFSSQVELAAHASLAGSDVRFAAADFNGDGWTDVVWTAPDADPQSPAQSLLLTAGGTAGARLAGIDARVFAPGLLVNELAAADLTGDGLPDLLATSDSGVYLAPGTRAGPLVENAQPFGGAPGAGKALIVPSAGSSAPNVYLASTAGAVVRLAKGADGVWTASSALSQPVADFAVGDVNGDGLPDLVTIEGERLLARTAGSSGDFGPPALLVDRLEQNGQTLPMVRVAIGDADGVEAPDVVVARRGSGGGSIVEEMLVLPGRREGGFYATERVRVDGQELITADFLRLVDLDGQPPAEVIFSGNPSGVRAGSGQVQTSRPNLVASAPASASAVRDQTLRVPLTVANRGAQDATGATLEIALPPSLVPAADEVPAECGAAGSGLSCRLGTVASGTTREVRLAVRGQASGKVTVSLRARSAEADVSFADNDLVFSVEVVERPSGAGTPPRGSGAGANPPAPKPPVGKRPTKPAATKGVRRLGTGGADMLRGTPFADVLDGRAGPDRIFGYAGNDVLTGGAGRDGIDAGKGNDTIRARDRARDAIRCGPGSDTVVADRVDVLTGCEKVSRR